MIDATDSAVPDCPRVTEVIQLAGLGADFSRIRPDVLAAAQLRGTLVHKAVELVDDGALDRASVPEHLRGYVGAYDDFVQATGYQPIATELELRHPLGFVGHPDGIGWIGAARVLRDIKTPVSLAVGPLLLQLAAYVALWNHEFPREPIAYAAALKLGAERTYQWRRHELAIAFGVFASALSLIRGEANAAQLAAITAWSRRYPNS